MNEEIAPLRGGRRARAKVPTHYRSTWAAPPRFFHENSYNIFMDCVIFCFGAMEIGLVLYLSIHHFLDVKENSVEAMAMLLPIALNFIGVMYFLSNPEERFQFETIGCTRCCTDILQFPVIGPVLTALMIFLISCGWSQNMENYQRLEASATKMRQAITFFSGAPEALVQLTVLLISEDDNLSFDRFLEIAVVIITVIAIAEANTFSLISNYYRIFHKYEPGDWHSPHKTKFWQKLLLFFHAFTSIGSRVIASAFVKAGTFYLSHKEGTAMFALILIPVLLAEMGYRTVLYYIARLLKHLCLGKEIPSGCIESMNFGWRETILGFGFQSQNICVQAMFYIENLSFFIFWIWAVQGINPGESMFWVRNMPFTPISIIFCVLTLGSLVLLLTIHCLKIFVIHGPLYDREDHE